MSVSAIFGCRLAMPPNSSFLSPSGIGGNPTKVATRLGDGGVTGFGGLGLVVECSSRPQKKATKHHMKTRPRKTQAWDIKRKPTVYPPLPPLPPDFTLVTNDGGAEGAAFPSLSTSPSVS